MALDRAVDLSGALEGCRTVAPLAKAAATVPGDCGFEIFAGGGHQVRDPPAHAETKNTDTAGVDEFARLVIIHRRADIFDDVHIARSSTPRRPIVLAIGTVAMIEIRRHREISLRRRARGHLLHELIDAVLVLDHDDCRHGLVTRRPSDEQIHPAIVYANLLMICLHR